MLWKWGCSEMQNVFLSLNWIRNCNSKHFQVEDPWSFTKINCFLERQSPLMWWPSLRGSWYGHFKDALLLSLFPVAHHSTKKLNWKVDSSASWDHWKAGHTGFEWRHDFDSYSDWTRVLSGLTSFHLYSKFSPIYIFLKRLSNTYISQKFLLPPHIFPAPNCGHVIRLGWHLIQVKRSDLLFQTWSWDLEVGPINWEQEVEDHLDSENGMAIAGGHVNCFCKLMDESEKGSADKERWNEHAKTRKIRCSLPVIFPIWRRPTVLLICVFL